MSRRTLLLADGTSYQGEAFGADREVSAEVVFTTGMTGYQETLTDQSYNGQIVTFTYPLIGNCGINRDDMESLFPTTAGVICREVPRLASNWRNRRSLDEFLTTHGIPGLAGIDTRALVRRLRTAGVMKGVLLAPDADLDAELGKLRDIHLPTDQIAQVSTCTAYPSPLGGRSVVLFDFGLKHSILRELSRRGCAVTVVPWNISADRVRALAPDGIMLSNGPGDPKSIPGYRMWCENCRRSTRSSVFAWATRSLLWLTVPIPISCVSAIAASTIPSASCRPVGSTSPARTMATPSIPDRWPALSWK